MSGKIAYLMSRFPHLPETFILREMVALEQLGWRIELYPLMFQKQAIVHEQARPWLDRAHRLPWLSGKVIWTNIQELRHRPGIYMSSLFQVLIENSWQSKIPD